MTLAVCLNVFNHVYYKRKAFVWLEFLPQILFMESIFGYLIFCIMYKWSVNWWELDSNGQHIHNKPPNLLNMLIYMFLTPGTVKPEDQLFPGQGPIQAVLLLIAVVCVPWMWFAKPFYLKREASQHHYESVAVDDDEEQRAVSHTEDDEEEEEEFDFSEVMIHQTIHTIEFCLNCISNTASYLRLWALSLAHARKYIYLKNNLFFLLSLNRTVECVMGYDIEDLVYNDRTYCCDWPCDWICYVVRVNDWYLAVYGRFVCLFARPSFDVG